MKSVKNIKSRISERLSSARKNVSQRARSVRESTMALARGLPDPHIDPHLSASGFKKLQENFEKMSMYMAIGHGTHHPTQPNVIIPHNVYVVFFTPPGYWGNAKYAIEDNFANLIGDKPRFINFLKGRLHEYQVPKLVKNFNWDWKHHIYPPGSECAAHSLEMFDNQMGPHRKTIHEPYDNLSGLYEIGSTQRLYHGTTQTLQNLVSDASILAGTKKAMLFIFGCRGDPRVPLHQMSSIFLAHMYNAPSTYNVPIINQYIPGIRERERRIRNGLNKPQYSKFFMNRDIKKVLNVRGLSQQAQQERINRLIQRYPNTNYIKNTIKSKLNEAQKRKNNAATKIQALVRGFALRKRLPAIREQKRKNNAVKKIQASFRGLALRTKFPAMREQLIKEKKNFQNAIKYRKELRKKGYSQNYNKSFVNSYERNKKIGYRQSANSIRRMKNANKTRYQRLREEYTPLMTKNNKNFMNEYLLFTKTAK